jgi:hypothetical protein
MDDLRAALAGWPDPELVGALMLDWGGRVVAALAIAPPYPRMRLERQAHAE